jgi:hypothetical protein
MDLWTCGARFGDVVKVFNDGSISVRLDKLPKKLIKLTNDQYRLI